MFDEKCKFCGSLIPVAKREIMESGKCPHCGRAFVIGEGQPFVEEIVDEVTKEEKDS